MNYTSLTITAVTALLLTLPAMAQIGSDDFDPLGRNPNLPRQIRVQVEFIEMAHTTYTELMRKPRSSSNDEGLRNACAKLVKEEKATVLETGCIVAKPGQKGTSEATQEFIYPTEYEPAYGVSTTKDGETKVEKADAPTGTTFDTQHLGLTFEVEPNIGADDQVIDIRIAPQLVYHVGNESWGKWKTKSAQVSLNMPKFYVLRFSTGITVLDGQPLMVTALSPKDQDGKPDTTRKIMTFVRADILITGK